MTVMRRRLEAFSFPKLCKHSVYVHGWCEQPRCCDVTMPNGWITFFLSFRAIPDVTASSYADVVHVVLQVQFEIQISLLFGCESLWDAETLFLFFFLIKYLMINLLSRSRVWCLSKSRYRMEAWGTPHDAITCLKNWRTTSLTVSHACTPKKTTKCLRIMSHSDEAEAFISSIRKRTLHRTNKGQRSTRIMERSGQYVICLCNPLIIKTKKSWTLSEYHSHSLFPLSQMAPMQYLDSSRVSELRSS